MPAPDTTEFDLTVRQVLTRNFDTDEEEMHWRVESENMDRPCVGDTAHEALQVFVAALTPDDEDVQINAEELEVDDSQELVEAE